MSSAPETNPPMELSQVSDTETGYQPEETPTVPEQTRDQGEDHHPCSTTSPAPTDIAALTDEWWIQHELPKNPVFPSPTTRSEW
ncbi:hypothetical protein L198_04513 [Cryptococcus wingfieldii CBS 7118]|uniref:Uncharacterized protein n=1 Tax=Cryptococcus wingfieldii CBS 7118 TaxID=1295528 RepID=A0A1E3J4W8_9TREE|nr:hypothetical protein L198_04513 [Cryptococcus wingfieldii CBS 7118]ODN95894.1 hypothetical protein L198_04513 [Cryptococcus wingfieldii CBS 7118]